MYDLILKNAKLIGAELIDAELIDAELIDGGTTDIAIIGGKIAEIGKINKAAKQLLDVKGQYYVSAGWIDAHTHCFARSPIYYDDPDSVGFKMGVTTIVDAGSVGALEVDEFYQLARLAKTHVYSLLNISKIGLTVQSELADMSDIDQPLFDRMLAKYPDFIIGLKVRMSRSIVGENGINPLLKAKEIQKKSGLPLMIHVGNNPPELDDIADRLTQGDIITHCFNGKPNKILNKNNELKDSIKRAIKRGVMLDIGHGGESFSFAVAKRAKNLGVYPNTVSSDIYSKNRLQGPVFSLANVMTKFIALGYGKARIIDSVTKYPAEILQLKNKGVLAVGYDADLTIFTLKAGKVVLSDAQGECYEANERFIPLACILADQATSQIEITKEGIQYGLCD